MAPAGSVVQASGSHGAPPPRAPPPVLPTSPTARTTMKRLLSQGPHLAAIVESSQSKSQHDPEEQTKAVNDNYKDNSRDDEWVMLNMQISTESAESKKFNTTSSQSSVDECAEATEDLTDSAEGDGAKKESGSGVDLDDIDAIVAEFEELRKQSETQDAEIEAQYATQRSQSNSTDVSESEVVLNNSADETVSFKPKKPLGFSNSLPVQTNTSTSDHLNNLGAGTNLATSTPESSEIVSTGSHDNLLGEEQAENLNYCVWDKEKKEQAKKKRGGSFFNKWRNKDKTPSDSDSKTALQNDPNVVANKNYHSENDLLSVNNGQTSENVDQLDGSGRKETHGIMRRLSRMVKNQAEDSDDGSSAGTPKKRKSRMEHKINFIDLTMEDVPKHPPHKKMTYGDHCHVGMCLNNL